MVDLSKFFKFENLRNSNCAKEKNLKDRKSKKGFRLIC